MSQAVFVQKNQGLTVGRKSKLSGVRAGPCIPPTPHPRSTGTLKPAANHLEAPFPEECRDQACLRPPETPVLSLPVPPLTRRTPHPHPGRAALPPGACPEPPELSTALWTHQSERRAN